MGTKERIHFEVGLAMDNDRGVFRRQISEWLGYTQERLIEAY